MPAPKKTSKSKGASSSGAPQKKANTNPAFVPNEKDSEYMKMIKELAALVMEMQSPINNFLKEKAQTAVDAGVQYIKDAFSEEDELDEVQKIYQKHQSDITTDKTKTASDEEAQKLGDASTDNKDVNAVDNPEEFGIVEDETPTARPSWNNNTDDEDDEDEEESLQEDDTIDNQPPVQMTANSDTQNNDPSISMQSSNALDDVNGDNQQNDDASDKKLVKEEESEISHTNIVK